MSETRTFYRVQCDPPVCVSYELDPRIRYGEVLWGSNRPWNIPGSWVAFSRDADLAKNGFADTEIEAWELAHAKALESEKTAREAVNQAEEYTSATIRGRYAAMIANTTAAHPGPAADDAREGDETR